MSLLLKVFIFGQQVLFSYIIIRLTYSRLCVHCSGFMLNVVCVHNIIDFCALIVYSSEIIVGAHNTFSAFLPL